MKRYNCIVVLNEDKTRLLFCKRKKNPIQYNNTIISFHSLHPPLLFFYRILIFILAVFKLPSNALTLTCIDDAAGC